VGDVVAERRTTSIELFWDLVFVFAVTQVTSLLRHDLSWAGLGRSLLALALIWWAWSAFVWASNAQDPDALGFRAVLLLASGLIFIAGLALPHAFGRDGTLFAATYAGVRFLHLALYVDASRRGNASLAAIMGFAVTVVIGMALLVAGSFIDGDGRVALWAAAAAIDYAGPAWLTRERLRGLQQVAVAHFAERYSLFIIICLGESIVGIGVGAEGRPLDVEVVSAVALSLLITIGLWWTYFDRFAATAEERLRTYDDPVLTAADAYSYLHLLLVAGIIVFAVGAKDAVANGATRCRTPRGWRSAAASRSTWQATRHSGCGSWGRRRWRSSPRPRLASSCSRCRAAGRRGRRRERCAWCSRRCSSQRGRRPARRASALLRGDPLERLERLDVIEIARTARRALHADQVSDRGDAYDAAVDVDLL
jgi:low temperature requirement protein LtrA